MLSYSSSSLDVQAYLFRRECDALFLFAQVELAREIGELLGDLPSSERVGLRHPGRPRRRPEAAGPSGLPADHGGVRPARARSPEAARTHISETRPRSARRDSLGSGASGEMRHRHRGPRETETASVPPRQGNDSCHAHTTPVALSLIDDPSITRGHPARASRTPCHDRITRQPRDRHPATELSSENFPLFPRDGFLIRRVDELPNASDRPQEVVMHPAPPPRPVPPVFEHRAVSVAVLSVAVVHGVDAPASRADTPRRAPRWGA